MCSTESKPTLKKSTYTWGVHLSDQKLREDLVKILEREKVAHVREESLGFCDFIEKVLAEYRDEHS